MSDITATFLNFGEVLAWRTKSAADTSAFVFTDGDAEIARLTYSELDFRARSVAAELERRQMRGERVVLVNTPGLDFITSFLGCLYSGVIAVPVTAPRARNNDRLKAIVADCAPKLCLTTRSVLKDRENVLQTLFADREVLATDDFTGADSWKAPAVGMNDLAFLQYTSGSTGDAKGVQISHGNLIHNAARIADAFAIRSTDIGVSWLPHFHDMGLVGSIVEPIFSGVPMTLFAPVKFIEQPLRWLKAISETGATISGGPNFAYDVCANKIADEDLVGLDLSNWRLAYAGSEMVKPETLDRFAKRFASCGFRREAFYPCYGLAESTLLVTGVLPDEPPAFATVDSVALQNHQVVDQADAGSDAKLRTLVSCGTKTSKHKLAIVNPDTHLRCADDEVGEIWIAGPSVAHGYWQRDEINESQFEAEIVPENGHKETGRYLRTGDLGFVRDGELYVTGRLTEMIIVRGRNYYPCDIEATAEKSHSLVREGGVAAFAETDATGEERVIILAELEHAITDGEYEPVLASIRRNIADEHELQLSRIRLLKQGRLPRTANGKIQRRESQSLAGKSPRGVLAEWHAAGSNGRASANGNGHARHKNGNGNGHAPPAAKQVVASPLSNTPFDDIRNGNGKGNGHKRRFTPPPEQPKVSTQNGTSKHTNEPLAVVGMACRFPGAENLKAFLNLLRSGGSGITEIPPERWDVDQHYDPDPEALGKTITRWGGFLKDIDLFDANLFGVLPREATRMDPQQRLLVECCWELFENAGISPDDIAGSQTGCFIGIGGTDYSNLQLQYEYHLEGIDAYTGTGNAHSLAANRLSYLYDMRGPSLAIDTACSSSLVALHFAAQSLREGRSDAAVVGGVNLILTPEVTIAFSKARMLSRDGRCFTFDERANGYVRGEGVGLVLIKRLKDAEAAGDNIVAVIRGTACNQDGRTTGVAAPNVDAQEEVIRAALADGGLRPEDVGYVEAHGTGTPIGDPIEVEALRRVFQKQHEAENNGHVEGEQSPVHLGSVKANIGHLETASGIAGLMKVLVMLQQGEIYRQINFENLNPNVRMDGSRLKLALEPQKWQPIHERRIAGLNSFGFGGTNAHVVLEAANLKVASKKPDSKRPERPRQLMVLSAHRESALKNLANEYAKLLGRTSLKDFPNVVSSTNTTRPSLTHRLSVHGATAFEMSDALRKFAADENVDQITSGHARRGKSGQLGFLFTGQGSQYAGMGKQLFDTDPNFRRSMEDCSDLLEGELDVPLLEVLYGDDLSLINNTAYTQPALFALEWSLAQMWNEWGIHPDAVLGHSIGEYAAAAVAGVFSWQDGLRLVTARGRLMQSLPHDGSMAVFMAGPEEVESLLAPHAEHVAIATLNGPAATVISGRTEAVDAVLQAAALAGVKHRKLVVSHAFHSPLMDPILDEFESLANSFTYQAPLIPLASNVTGKLFGTDGVDEVPDARYWRDHIREAVQFERGIKALEDFGCDRFLELGPTPSLTRMGRTCLPPRSAAWFNALQKDTNDWQRMFSALGAIYCEGADVELRRLDRGYHRTRKALPPYPLERERFWMSPETEELPTAGFRADRGAHPLLGTPYDSPLESVLYHNCVSTKLVRFLADHAIHGGVLFPGAGYLEMGLAAARESLKALGEAETSDTLIVENVEFRLPLFLADDVASLVQFVARPESNRRSAFQIYARPSVENSKWTSHVNGTCLSKTVAEDGALEPIDLVAATERCATDVPIEEFYSQLAERGLQYGSNFQGLTQLSCGDNEAVGQVAAPEKLTNQVDKYVVHPALLDASFHVLAAAMPEDAESDDPYLPMGVERLIVHRSPGATFHVHAKWNCTTSDDPMTDEINGDVLLLDEDGNLQVEVRGLRFKRLAAPTSGSVTSQSWQDWLYQLDWKELDALDSVPEDGEAPEHLEGGLWLIFADEDGVGSAISRKFTHHDLPYILVTHGIESRVVDDHHLEVGLGDETDVWNLLEQTCHCDAVIRGAIHLWQLDIDDFSEDVEQRLIRTRQLGAESSMKLLAGISAKAQGVQPRVWFVSMNSQRVAQSADPISIGRAPLWGLARVGTREQKDVRTAVVDLQRGGTNDEFADIVWSEVWHQDREEQIARRDEKRYGLRLERYDLEQLEAGGNSCQAQVDRLLHAARPFHLEVGQGASIDTLTVNPATRHAVEPNQVEIKVEATGLNFSDVLKALDLYPGIEDDIVPLGIECAGTVSSVGSDVTNVKVGDKVMALAPYSFGSYCVTYDYGVMPLPEEVSYVDAAAMPVAYITAHYCMVTLGRLQPGERILIHAAAGGVGQAAIRIAQSIGAEIFATAGTDEKRDFLRNQGVQHVFDSRSLEFADEIREVTDGEGIDMVLNSLAGDAIPRSLALLRSYGRFLEIGKTEIYQNRMLGLSPFRNNLSYFAVDMDRLFRERPAVIRQLLAEICEQIASGDYSSLPVTEFSMPHVQDAFRYMMQRKNIGKIVVAMKTDAEDVASTRPQVQPGRTYLVTGGLGELGLRVADSLAASGATHLALAGRSEPSDAAQEAIARLEECDVTVTTVRLDVGNRADVFSAVETINNSSAPLGGVVHAAGVLEDSFLLKMTAESLEKVMRPKVDGALHLHDATKSLDLDCFIMFSSIASVLGSEGQANYAAGNAFLDSLAEYRQQCGLPALTINWGPWQGGGMAGSEAMQKALEQRGVLSMRPHLALAALDHLLAQSRAQVMVASMDWSRALRNDRNNHPPMVADLAANEGVTHELGGDGEFLERVKSAAPDEARQLITEHLVTTLSRVTSLASEQIDVTEPIRNLGLDSLMAVELMHAVESSTNITIPMATLFQDPSIEQLAGIAYDIWSGKETSTDMLADVRAEEAAADSASTNEVETPAESELPTPGSN